MHREENPPTYLVQMLSKKPRPKSVIFSSGLDRLNTGLHWLLLVCAENKCCQAQTLIVLNY